MVYRDRESSKERAALLTYIYCFLLVNDLSLLLLLFLLLPFADIRVQSLQLSHVNQTRATSLASPKSPILGWRG